MRADARFSKALAELTLAAMASSDPASAPASTCDGTAIVVARREHALVVRCELAVPAEPCPDGRTVVVSDAPHESLPLMVPGRRVELRVFVRPEKDPACGPAFTAACGRKLVAAIAAFPSLLSADLMREWRPSSVKSMNEALGKLVVVRRRGEAAAIFDCDHALTVV